MVPNEQKLLALLSNNDVTFFIPPYQRNYEWTDDQCKVFLSDVIKTAESNRNGKQLRHFFGSVTYFADDTVFGQATKLILIDGQQRITTTMLFLAALRDLLEDETQVQFINNRYLKNPNASEDTEYKIKLKQVESDWLAYKKIILSEEFEDKDKNASVYRNYMFFKNKLNALKKEGQDLVPLMQYGLDNFSIVTLELQPKQNKWENPQEIFESMNSIGKPLSLADLVRNYLLLGLDAETQNKYYNKFWLKIEQTIPSQISSFIRDYMQGKEARSFKQATETNYKELYSQFKEVFVGVDAFDLLSDLALYSPIYASVVNGKSTGDTSVDKALKGLRDLKATVVYSFIMMLVGTWKEGKFNADELVEIIDAITVYYLRRRIIAVTNAENKVMPTLVSRIPELIDASDKKLAMFKILASQENNLRLPNDIEVTRELETMNFYSFKYCKYYLALIEESITKSRPDLNDPLLQIEHIMPRTLNDAWKEELGGDYERIHQQYVHTIGNLTLIRHNQELSNRSFAYKKDVYENKAGLQIAKTSITNRTKWNEKSIKDRSKWIIQFLLDNVLEIPDKMRRTNNYIPKEGRHLSFLDLQLIGEDINFIDDPSVVAHVVSDKEVEFEGKKWRLSNLTREIYERRGFIRKSGAFDGADHWEFDGMKLADLY